MGRAARHGDFARIGVEVEADGHVGELGGVEVLVGEDAEAVVYAVEMARVVDEVVTVAVIGADNAVGRPVTI